MAFYAHRDEKRFYLLSAHLAGVAAGAAARAAAFPRREELVAAALVAGLSHDFGKYTSYFQDYLRTGRGGSEKQHAFLSALWAAHLARSIGLPAEQQLVLFLAVARHHQHLADPGEYLVAPRALAGDWEELSRSTQEQLRVAAAQVADLEGRGASVAASLRVAARRTARLLAREGLPAPGWLQGDWEGLLAGFLGGGWKESLGALYSAWRRWRRQLGPARPGEHQFDLKDYFSAVAVFSALIDADKIHAARVEEPGRIPVSGDAVERFRAARFGGPRTGLEALREDLYREVLASVQSAPLGQRLFTLTAPTGAGKTLAGLAAAFCLRERLAAERGFPPRLIYALPFTSIVDQTYAVAEEVLRAALPGAGEFLPTSLLLKHHHLADLVYRRPGQEAEAPLEEALLLTESWQSEVIVTTFVQLFHTLIGCENRMLKKFHRLAGAVVILDEVQNIPVEYWPLVEECLRQAAANLDLHLILMTATRPEWFRPGEALELAGDPEAVRSRFAALNRVRLKVDTAPRTVEEAAAAFLEDYRPGLSYLVVLNTIKSSVAFYELLRAAWGGRGPKLIYLSTNIVPAERERRLAEIRRCLAAGEKPVVVSTQVVEAGVDLDFDVVWRDLGPVDAVVQVAGRCNRHFRREQGEARLVHLVEERAGGRSLADYVYGKIHTWAARCVFEGRKEVSEPEFFSLVGDYFRTVRAAKSAEKSTRILEAMASLRFATRETAEGEQSVKDFALIEEFPKYVDVFVCLDEAAEEIWRRYQESVARERDLSRRRAAFLELKRDFRRYLLSVPGKELVHRLQGEARPLVIPSYLLEEFYDRETGFRRAGHEEALFY